MSHAVLLMIPGVAVAAVNRLRPKLLSLKAASWLFATLAIWSALLRMPLYGACSLVLAAGLARPIGDAVVGPSPALAADAIDPGGDPRPTRLSWQPSRRVGGRSVNHRTVAGLPPAPPGARNVVLIVWDTVRAS